MIWGKTNEEYMATSKWHNKHKWFAWYPVYFKDGRWVWWEYVNREFCCYRGGSSWEYTRGE